VKEVSSKENQDKKLERRKSIIVSNYVYQQKVPIEAREGFKNEAGNEKILPTLILLKKT
jgi:hypothetical protein